MINWKLKGPHNSDTKWLGSQVCLLYLDGSIRALSFSELYSPELKNGYNNNNDKNNNCAWRLLSESIEMCVQYMIHQGSYYY